MALTNKEALVIELALQNLIECHVAALSDPTIPFTPEARELGREVLRAARSAYAKINAETGHSKMEPFLPGDEKEFLTKES